MNLCLSSFRALALALAALSGGCALIPPDPVVTGPLTATPPAGMAAAVEANGAIYQPEAYGNFTLFEDGRPRDIGDIVTVIIQEKTNAAKNVQTSTDRNGKAGFGAELLPSVLPGALAAKQQFDVSGENQASGKGSSRADNRFEGTISATVISVLPNGNLRIAGDKQIAINRGSEHIRFSGVIDPKSVTASNSVLSTQVADARIEFRSKGTMDEVQTMGWLQRFFLNISPF